MLLVTSHSKLLRPFGPVLALPLLLGACQSGMCGAPRYWASDGYRTVGEGALVGAGVGAAVGGVALLAGGGGKGAGGAALVLLPAIAGGAVIGGLIGCAVSAAKSEAAAREDNYDSRLAAMTRLNEDLAARLKAMRDESANQQAQIKMIQLQSRASEAGKARAASMQRTLAGEVAKAQNMLAAAQQDLQKEQLLIADAEKQFGAGSEQVRKMREQKNQTLRVVEEMQAHVRQLVGSNDSLGSI